MFVAFNTFVTIRGISMTKGLDFVIFAIEILAVIAFVYLASKHVLGGGTGAFVIDPLWQPGKVDAHFVAPASPSPRSTSSVLTASRRWSKRRTSLRRTSAAAS